MSLWVDGLSLVFFGEQGTGFPAAVRGTPEGRGNGKVAAGTDEDEEGKDGEGIDEVWAFPSPVGRVDVAVEVLVRVCCPTICCMKGMKNRIVMRTNERRWCW